MTTPVAFKPVDSVQPITFGVDLAKPGAESVYLAHPSLDAHRRWGKSEVSCGRLLLSLRDLREGDRRIVSFGGDTRVEALRGANTILLTTPDKPGYPPYLVDTTNPELTMIASWLRSARGADAPPKAEATLALEEIERELQALQDRRYLIRHPDFNAAYIDVGLTVAPIVYAPVNPHKPVILAGHSEAPLDAPYQRIPVGSYIIAVPFGVPIGKEIIRVPHANHDSERVFLWDLRDAARRLLVARCTVEDRLEGRDVLVHRPSDHDLSALADHFKAEKRRQLRIVRHDVAMGFTSERETENARRIAQAFAAPAPAAATFSDLSASPPACRMLPKV